MPDSHGLMFNLGWEDLWRLSGPVMAQGMTQHLVQGDVLDFLEENILERTRNKETGILCSRNDGR